MVIQTIPLRNPLEFFIDLYSMNRQKLNKFEIGNWLRKHSIVYWLKKGQVCNCDTIGNKSGIYYSRKCKLRLNSGAEIWIGNLKTASQHVISRFARMWRSGWRNRLKVHSHWFKLGVYHLVPHICKLKNSHFILPTKPVPRNTKKTCTSLLSSYVISHLNFKQQALRL